MKKSKIFETIYKELVKLGKLKKSFTRNELFRLIKIHQKYSSFVYKHSNPNNLGKMTLFFIRGEKINGLISFKIDLKIVKEYFNYFNISKI